MNQIIGLIVLFFIPTNSEVFTSIADVVSLLETQERTVEDLEKYITKETARLKELTVFLEHYKKHHAVAVDHVASYVANPINTYTLIKRLTADLDLVKDIADETTEFTKSSSLLYPTDEDLDGAILALFRLQTTYRLNVTQLASGELTGHYSNNNQQYSELITPMSASDCYLIGNKVHELKMYKSALWWLMEAYHRMTKQEGGGRLGFTAEDVVLRISSSYRGLGEKEMAEECFHLLTEEHNKTQNLQYNEMKEIRRIREEKCKMYDYDDETDDYNYNALCRGEFQPPSEIVSRLKCRYVTEIHPLLKLAPLKLEQLFLDPDLMLFHDVLSDAEIQHLKDLAQPRFERAKVMSPNGTNVPTLQRISKFARLVDHETAVMSRVTRRISHLTGLSLRTAEKLQVANYGIGGHFAMHYDFSLKYHTSAEDENGNRIATVLFYLSDVEQGGATVFPNLGLSVFPTRGAALFWMNLHPSGEGDLDTLHAACPVLRGSKWVSNKWILQTGQELLRPCNLIHQREFHTRNIAPRKLK